MSGELVGDFMDYFLLGGRGGEFAQTYGLTDFSMQYDDQAKRVGLKKKLTDDFKIGLELEQVPGQPGETTAYARKLEGEMSMTSHLSVNVSKKILPEEKSAPKTTQEIQQEGETQVYLKYKENF